MGNCCRGSSVKDQNGGSATTGSNQQQQQKKQDAKVIDTSNEKEPIVENNKLENAQQQTPEPAVSDEQAKKQKAEQEEEDKKQKEQEEQDKKQKEQEEQDKKQKEQEEKDKKQKEQEEQDKKRKADQDEQDKKLKEQEEEKARQLLEQKKKEQEEADRKQKEEEENAKLQKEEAEKAAKKQKDDDEEAEKVAEAERKEKAQREEQEAAEAAEREKKAEEQEKVQQQQKQRDSSNSVTLPAEMQKQIDDYAIAVRQHQESAKASKVLPNLRDRRCYDGCNANPSIMGVDKVVGRENGKYRENVKQIVAGSGSHRETHNVCAEIIGSFFFAFPPEPAVIVTDAQREAEGRRLNEPCSLCFFLKGAKITELTNSNDGAHVVLLESALPSPSDEKAWSVELIFDDEESMLRFEIAVENIAVSGISSLPSEECKEAMFLKYGRSVFVKKQ